MSSKITGKEYTLLKIFSSDFEYQIPAYQRPYAWTKEETGVLFDDLYSFYQSEQEDNYFLGTIVLIKEDDKPVSQVVDGQQRLTTLTIMFSVIAARLKDEGALSACKELLKEKGNKLAGIPNRPRMQLRDLDQDFFNRYIQKVQLSALMEIEPKKLPTEAQLHIQENCKVLCDRFEREFSDDETGLIKFSEFLLNRCYLVAVSTDNKDSAFRVFSVMNSRGLNLLPIDIIKSDIIGDLPDEKQAKYTDKWEELENMTGRDGFNEVFTHTRTIFAKERPKKNLLEEFKEYVIPKASPEELINDYLTPYAEAYVCIKGAQYESTRNAEKINTMLYWLNKIDNYDWMPPAIKFIAEHPNDSDYTLWFLTKLERLASFLYATAQDVNQRMDRYKRVLVEMDSNPDTSLEKPLERIELNAEEKKSFLQALDGEIYMMPSRRRNYIIQRLDSFVSDGAARYDSAVFSIEHVLPQNPQNDSEWMKLWPDSKEREEWLNRIANLVPLTRQRNSQAQNYDFETKKTKYFQTKGGVTSYALTTQVVNISSWTPDVVKKRQQTLLDILTEKWDLKIVESELQIDIEQLLFYLAVRGCDASGVAGKGSTFIVKKGSTIAKETTESFQPVYAEMRTKLMKNNIIKDFTFAEDYAFDSVSAAACVVTGRSANGRREWKTLDGRTFGQVAGK